MYYTDDFNFAVQVNKEDHMQVIVQKEGADLQGVFSRLCKAMETIDASVTKTAVDGG